jgi:Ras association domain-containing protein 2/4
LFTERRLVRDHELPLHLRVNLGPHEDIAKLYLLDRNSTSEIRPEVAQFIRYVNIIQPC